MIHKKKDSCPLSGMQTVSTKAKAKATTKTEEQLRPGAQQRRWARRLAAYQ